MQLDVTALADAVRRRDRAALGRAITLVESAAEKHVEPALRLLAALWPHRNPHAVRLGITGVPGAGKSTLIEALGAHLVAQGRSVAVLAVDPSSTLAGGSVLGDKTRMERLARHPDCFIRPSPSSGQAGGVAPRTPDVMGLCAAAGFDVIIVETVGVGQGEVALRDMVDCFVLVLLPELGDALQGIKRGIVELADVLVVNKADGDLAAAAARTQREYAHARHMLRAYTPGWEPPVLSLSSAEERGIDALWDAVARFVDTARASGAWDAQRSRQERLWVQRRVTDEMVRRWLRTPDVQRAVAEAVDAWLSGAVPWEDIVERLQVDGGTRERDR